MFCTTSPNTLNNLKHKQISSVDSAQGDSEAMMLAKAQPDKQPLASRHTRLRGWLYGGAVCVVGIVWALLAHIASVANQASNWGCALALAPICFSIAIGLVNFKNRWLASLAGVILFAGLIYYWTFFTGRVALLFYLEHLGVYLLLLMTFARTLHGAGESIVTRMARSLHGGQLSLAQEIYTRKVTIVWCVFFGAMAIASTLLFLLAPLTSWSTFANLLGGPLIGLMFAAEYLYRRMIFPQIKQPGMTDMVKAWKEQSQGVVS